MLLRDTQSTFGGGEVTPALWGRTDIQKYKTALRTGRNVNTMPQGGVRNRPGTMYVAAAGDSSHAVRLIQFIASSSVAYIIELGDFYARFYTADAQVQSGMSAYEISTPWAAADLFQLKFTQSADVMYFAHPNYKPQQLTYTGATSWTIADFAFVNGPFMPENTDTTWTITASDISGSVTLTSSKSLFQSGHVDALFQMIWTIVGQTITPSLSASVVNWIPTNSTWSATISGTWSGTILIQTSPDNVTWTTVATVTSNTTVSGSTGFTNGYMRAIMQSALSFSGTATVALTGNGNSTGPTTLSALNSATAAVPAGDTAVITLTSLSGTGDTVVLQRSDDAGATWNTLASYTTNQAATSVATTKTACLIRAQKTVNGGGTPAATVNGTTGAAPTLTFDISSASVSQAIQCGQNWSVITTGTWTGKIRIEVSTDGGNNWNLVQALNGASTNFNTSGQTGVRQCLLRVSGDPTVAFSGSAVVSLTSSSFDWTGVVKITAVASTTSATATVQNLSNKDSSGLASTSATYQWSEGSWSTYRGWPACVAFYQDRSTWASTMTQPNTVWHSKTASYLDFGDSFPVQDDDGFDVVLASRQLNSVNALVPMPQALIALSNDTAFGLAPGANGVYSASSIQQTPMDHRGSYPIDPVIVGNEIILIQQMGTVVRNFIFQLAVNGFMGDNISVSSQHMFTGYTIKQMAYQQEPDSIIWAVRSDGVLLSCAYDRAQEMNAWNRHDTKGGLFESVAVIPNQTLGINEVWFVVNRSGTRFIEVLKPRDQGTVPADQWFVDAGLQYSGTPTTTITGLSHLNGYTVAVLADGNVVANGINDGTPIVVAGGQITLPNGIAASKVTVGIGTVWDVGLLDIETPNQKMPLQGQRVKQPRAKIRVWNSRGGYISTTDPASDYGGVTDKDGGSFDAIADIMQRDPSTHMDTALPLVTGIADVTLPSGYQYGSHICLRGIDPLPFTLLDVLSDVVPGGN
jgi:hypothetical protein